MKFEQQMKTTRHFFVFLGLCVCYCVCAFICTCVLNWVNISLKNPRFMGSFPIINMDELEIKNTSELEVTEIA